MASLFISALLGIAAVRASPTLVSRQSINGLSTSQVNAFTVYSHFAGAALCPASTTQSWSCGVHCASNSDFKPVASGGDGNSVQYWYVGYEPSLNTVIVAHQGTNKAEVLSLLTDADAVRGKLDPSLFPMIDSNIEVHHGFRDDHSKTASSILSSVQTTLSKYGTNSVTLVGHSLGAALSLLDSVYLPLHLPAGTTFRSVVYGLPRVGNQAFANYVDANLHVTHINNMKDPIPTTPGKSLGYVHPSGEVHITETGEWDACPGQDNPDKQCIVGTVSSIFSASLQDHDGPYNGVKINCSGK